MNRIPSIDVDQVPLELDGFTVLDVREPIEWNHGHLAGSVHIPMMDLPQRLGEVPADSQVLVVCKVGGRSAQVVGYLVGQGIDAVNLAGGLIEWTASGRPLISDSGQPQVI